VAEAQTHLTLGEVDRDGALLEAIASVHGSSRADFLRTAAVGGGALLAALAEPQPAEAKAPRDEAILNYALAFEYLQSEFYTETDRLGTIAGMPQNKAVWARTLGAHERAHVRILKLVLGKAAVKKPSFDFRGNTESEDRFTRTAVAMEDLTVALLTGQVPRFRQPALVAAAFSLLTVEARHAAWARHIAGFVPVAGFRDEPKTLTEVDRFVASTRFISTLRPRTTSRRRPRFTG
jgi:Ferritin-like domain